MSEPSREAIVKVGEEDMAVGEERQVGEAAVNKFPAGMRVLAVDDDPVSLKLLETLLRRCNYHATTARDAETALQMLREGKDQFDLVISDVHMPDMDGFKLLELVGLEMDLPVIMLSANEETETVMKGITHGACYYLVKPVHAKELRNIWQHVVRRTKPDLRNRNSGGNDDADQKVQGGIAEGEQGGAKSTRKYSRNKRNDGDDSDENKENTDLSTRKKPRVTWTSELHAKFLEVVNRIGIDRAVPKKILDMMDVDYMTRESVASHLQKYRLYLKRVSGYTRRKPNPFADASERWNSSYSTMNELESFKHHHEHGRWRLSPAVDVASSSSNNLFARMNYAHGVLPTQPIQLRNARSNLGMRTVAHGGSMLKDDVPVPLQPDARRCRTSGSSSNPFANTSNDTMLDAFPSCHSGQSYANILRGKLLEASKGIPSCHTGNSFANTPNGRMLVPVNQFPVQAPQLGSKPSVQMNPSSMGVFGTLVSDASQFSDLGNCSKSWQTAAPSRFPDLGHKDGTSLGRSQANIPKINQLARFAASSGQIPMFRNELQNQMAAIMSNTASVAGTSEHMAPLNNTASNTSSVEILNDNLAFGSASSISSTLPNLQIGSSIALTQMLNGGSISSTIPKLQIDSSVAPTQMLNGGVASGTLPVQEGTVDQQAVDDQLNYSNDFLIGTNGSGCLDDIFDSMLNQDFIEDDAFMDGDW